MILTGESRGTWRKICPSATLFTNPTCAAFGANPGFRGEKLSTKRLYYGAAIGLLLLEDTEILVHNLRYQ
jgi:hypothetical protein